MGLTEKRLKEIGSMLEEAPANNEWARATRELYDDLVRIRGVVLKRGSVLLMGKDPPRQVVSLLRALLGMPGKRRSVTTKEDALPITWTIEPRRATSAGTGRVFLRVTAYNQERPKFEGEGSIEDVLAQLTENDAIKKGCAL